MNLMADEPSITLDHLPNHLLRITNRQKEKFALPAPSSPERPEPSNLPDAGLKKKISRFEADFIRQVLQKHNGNVTRAAKELNMSRQNLQYRLRKFGIRP
jgi:arginine utilization regulatory protein